ncbi:hypothetical protein SMICM304S_10891 [Streptomyces microflavus]
MPRQQREQRADAELPDTRGVPRYASETESSVQCRDSANEPRTSAPVTSATTDRTARPRRTARAAQRTTTARSGAQNR